MSSWARLGVTALAYHLERRGRLPWIAGATVVVAEAWMAAIPVPASRVVQPGAALGAGIVVVVLGLVGGGVARETRAGRAALWVYAARARWLWLLVDAAFRIAAALLVAGILVVAVAFTVGVVAGSPRGRTMLDTLGFLMVVALCMAAVAYAFSAASSELDGLLAALWIFPVSLVGTGLALAHGHGWSAWLWPCFPFDALAAIAPDAVAQTTLLPGPPPLPRITGFVAGWLICGGLVGWVRLGGATDAIGRMGRRFRRRP